MATPTKEELLACLDLVEEPAELTQYAAAGAAKELATNWATALHDGSRIETILDDVDRVIMILLQWKEAVGVRFVKKE